MESKAKKKCNICNIYFQEQIFSIHQKFHSEDKFHPCDLCGAVFFNEDGLTKHKRHTKHARNMESRHTRDHTDEKPYACDVCEKSFSESSSLAKHKRIHTGEKPYACDVCEKSFSVSSSLALHKRIHTGEKPYACDVCKKTFSVEGNLARHKRIHTGEKPYACDLCKKSFSVRSSLARHKQIHVEVKPNKAIKEETMEEETNEDKELSISFQTTDFYTPEQLSRVDTIDIEEFKLEAVEENIEGCMIVNEIHGENKDINDSKFINIEQRGSNEEDINKSEAENTDEGHIMNKNKEVTIDGDQVAENRQVNEIIEVEEHVDNSVIPILENVSVDEALAFFSS